MKSGTKSPAIQPNYQPHNCIFTIFVLLLNILENRCCTLFQKMLLFKTDPHSYQIPICWKPFLFHFNFTANSTSSLQSTSLLPHFQHFVSLLRFSTGVSSSLIYPHAFTINQYFVTNLTSLGLDHRASFYFSITLPLFSFSLISQPNSISHYAKNVHIFYITVTQLLTYSHFRIISHTGTQFPFWEKLQKESIKNIDYNFSPSTLGSIWLTCS